MTAPVNDTITDIVDRLRQPMAWAKVWGGTVTADTTPTDAADEIERLRDVVKRLHAERRALRKSPDNQRDGNRPLPFSRDDLGRMVREAWVRWAQTQPNPKPTWLVPYEELAEPDKEADRQIGEAVARWTLIGDAASGAITSG